MRRVPIAVMLAVAGVAVLGIGGVASANISATAPTITPIGSVYQWSYTLSIDSAQYIPVSGLQPCTTTGVAGAGTPCSFFTLFDVQGLTGTPTFTSSLSGFTGTVTTPLTGPVAYNSSVPDSASIPNIDVAFKTTGSTIIGTTLGTLTFDDTLGGTTLGQYSAQADASATNFASGNQAQELLPAPEPASLALFGPGLLGLVAMRRRRREAA